MAELINSTYVTLDGVIGHPETWPSLGGFDAEGNRVQTELLLGCSAVVMGRRTYDGFAEVWPTMSGNELADKMNSMPKYVASTTLTAPRWNNTHVVAEDPVGTVERLKNESDGDLVQFGFGAVSRQLLAGGLIDRLRLWLHPFVIGRGAPEDLLFGEAPVTEFDLDRVTSLASGIVIVDYRVRKDGS
jgi:dihydrofolate reductase